MKVTLLTEIARENTLLQRLEAGAREAKSAFIAVSFINSAGLTHLLSKITPLLGAGHAVTIYTSGYLKITEPKALWRLLKLAHTYDSLEVFFNPDDRFHSKFLLFQKPDRAYTLFMGSSNITLGGLLAAGELNIQIDGKTTDKVFDSVKIVMMNLIQDSSFNKIDETSIDEYEHEYELLRSHRKKVLKKKRKGVQTPPPPPSPKTMQIYVAEFAFTKSQDKKIRAAHPRWRFYLDYRTPLTTLKRNDLFLLISKVRGEKKKFTVGRYLEFDKVEGAGRIANVTKGKELSLEKLRSRLGSSVNALQHGTRLELVDDLILKRDFKVIFPQ